MKYIFFVLLAITFFTTSYSQQTTNYQYDKLSRLTKIIYSNGSSIAYQYDANGNRIAETRLAGTAVPVNLTDFLYQRQACNQIQLIWQTAQEINNAGFEVEQSKNGSAFSKIAFVAGAGTSSRPQQYRFAVVLQSNEISFFRLKQMDADGSFRFSKVVQFKPDCESNTLKLIPNPAQNKVVVQGLDLTVSHTIEIFDGSGNKVWQSLKTKTATIDITNLPQGFYIVAVDNKTHLRLIKQ